MKSTSHIGCPYKRFKTLYKRFKIFPMKTLKRRNLGYQSGSQRILNVKKGKLLMGEYGPIESLPFFTLKIRWLPN